MHQLATIHTHDQSTSSSSISDVLKMTLKRRNSAIANKPRNAFGNINLQKTLTLKLGLGVTEGHWKCHHSYSTCNFLLMFNSNYGSILCRFWDIQCRKMSWPWNPSPRSLKVIESGTIRYYYAALLPRRGRILRRTLSVCLCPSVPLSLPSVTSFRQPLASRMYFSARTEGRISYGHLGRTDSCFLSNFISLLKWLLSNFVPKMHSFWDIRLQKCRDLENRFWGLSRSLEISPINRAHTTSYWHSIVTMALSRVVWDIQCWKCRDLEIGARGHSRSSKVLSFDRSCMVSY